MSTNLEPAPLVLGSHEHTVLHVPSDVFRDITVTGVIDQGGPAVRIGPWSLGPDDARLIAASLVILADRTEGTAP